MGVVDQHRERLPLVDGLETPGHLAGVGEGGGRGLARHAEHVTGSERRKRVRDVEVARQRRAHLHLSVRAQASKPRPPGVELDVQRPKVGCLRPAGREGKER